MLAKKAQEPALAGLTSVSQTAIWRAYVFIFSACIHYHEQLWDYFKQDLEAIALKAVPGTDAWLYARVKEFQYSAESPQVVQMVDGYPIYVPVNESLRIISRASVKQQIDRRVIIKVAKAGGALSAEELSALKGYIAKIRFAGTKINILSFSSDKIKVVAEIFYLGEYVESTVKANVIAAINQYFASLPFDGVMYNQRLVNAIQAVEGVDDVVLGGVYARRDSEAVGQYIEVERFYETYAGYVVPEVTDGHTLADSLTLTLA